MRYLVGYYKYYSLYSNKGLIIIIIMVNLYVEICVPFFCFGFSNAHLTSLPSRLFLQISPYLVKGTSPILNLNPLLTLTFPFFLAPLSSSL